MKTKCLRIGKRTLSVVLSFLMIVSTLVVGNVGEIKASADSQVWALVDCGSSSSLPNPANLDGIKKLSDGSAANKTNLSKVTGTDDNYISVQMKHGQRFVFWKSDKTLSSDNSYGGASGANSVYADDVNGTTRQKLSGNKTLYFNNSSYTDYNNYRLFYNHNDAKVYAKTLYLISVTNTKGTHTITTTYDDDNKDSSNNYYAQKGETVTLAITPTDAATAYPVAVNGDSNLSESGGVYTYTYTVLDTQSGDIELEVTYSDEQVTPSHSITVNSHSGTDTIPTTEVAEGSTVNFTVTPPEGKVVDTITATGTTVSGTTNSETRVYTGSFTMPASDVTVTITYKDAPKTTYTIYYDNSESAWSNVYVWESGSSALGSWPGVQMTLDPSTGYYTCEIPKTSTSLMFNNYNIEQTDVISVVAEENHTYSFVSDIYMHANGFKEVTNTTVLGWTSNATNRFSKDPSTGNYYFDFYNPSSGTRNFLINISRNKNNGKTSGYSKTSSAALKVDGTQYSINNQSDGSNNTLTSATNNARYRIYYSPSSNTAGKIWIKPIYSVTLITGSNGTASKDVSYVAAGDIINITATPSQHYVISSVTATIGSGTASSVSMTYNGSSLGDGVGNYTGVYTVPSTINGNVTINASFKEYQYTGLTAKAQYTDDNLNWNDAGASLATASLSSNTAQPSRNTNPTASYTLTDSTNYAFIDWYSTKGTFTDSSATPTTFIPNADYAEAIARFAKKYSISTTSNDSNSTIKIDNEISTTKPVGSTVTLTINEADGKMLKYLTITKGTGENQVVTTIDVEDKLRATRGTDKYYDITMPADVTTVAGEFVDTPTYQVTVSAAYGTATVTNNNSSTTNDPRTASSTPSTNGTITVTKGESVTLSYVHSGAQYLKFAHWDIDSVNYAEYLSRNLTTSSITITPTGDITAAVGYELDKAQVANLEDPWKSGDGIKTKHVLFSSNKDSSTEFNANAATAYKPTNSNDGYYYAFLEPSILENLNNTDTVYFALSGTDKYDGIYGAPGSDTTAGITIADQYASYISVGSPVYSENNNNTKKYVYSFNILSSDVSAVIVKVNKNNAWAFELIPVVEEISSSSTGTSVTVYAKSGTVRSNENGRYLKYATYATTSLVDYYTKESATPNYSQVNGTYYTTKVTKSAGDKIIIKTVIDAAYKDTYYVKAFSVNGVSYNVIDEDTAAAMNGTYEFVYTIPANANVTAYEITPIFFYFEGDNTQDYIEFHVYDFDEGASAKWGNTISCYAWYGDENSISDVSRESLGGFPGQPLVNQNGEYYTQVKKSVEGYAVNGVTLNNYIWDDVHAEVVLGSESYTNEQRQRNNYQTYDYDDFVVLANNIQNVETISFKFKYNEANDEGYLDGKTMIGVEDLNSAAGENYPDRVDYENSVTYDYYFWQHEDTTTTYTGVNKQVGNNPTDATSAYGNANSFEYLTNQSGTKKVDIFRHELTSEQLTNSEWKIVSDGYKDTYFGSFATLWSVYDNTGAYRGTIPSSAFFFDLEIKDEDNNWIINPEYSSLFTTSGEAPNLVYTLNANNPPDDFMKDTTDKLYNERQTYWDIYKLLYNNANKHPVQISFESNIFAAYPMYCVVTGAALTLDTTGKSKNPAYRSDGLWYYTKDNDLIEANVKIMYKEIDTNTGVLGGWTLDTATTINSKNAGTVTQAKAYFSDHGSGKVYDQNNTSSYEYYIYKNSTGWVKAESSANFQVTADSVGKQVTNKAITIDETTKNYTTKFLFDGWYLESLSQSGYTYTSVDPGDVYNTKGEKVKNTDYVFVARYVEVIVNDMSIEHKLLNKDVDTTKTNTEANLDAQIEHILDKDGNVITPHAANGTTTVSKIEVLDSSDEVVSVLDSTAAETKTLSSTNLYYYAQQDQKLRITLSTTYNVGLSLGGFYNIAVPKNGSAARYCKGSDDTEIFGTSTQETKTNGSNVTTNVYVVPVSTLFNTGKTILTTTEMKLRSDIIRSINVTLYYYDRDLTHGVAADVRSDASHLTVPYEITYENNVKALSRDVSIEFSKGISNVLDTHVFWFTQSAAITGMRGEKDYQNSTDKTSIVHDADRFVTILRGKNYDDLDADGKVAKDNEVDSSLMYHRDQYGGVIRGSTVKWATYNDLAGAAIIDDPTDNTSLDSVGEVILWAYNKPRDYKFTAHYTAETIDAQTEKPVVPEIATVYTTIDNSTVYIENDDTTPSEELHGFYNQRVGKDDDRENLNSDYGINDGVNYLTGRGIGTTVNDEFKSYAYFSTKRVTDGEGIITDTTDYKGFEIKAPSNATTSSDSATVNLVFDGWYVQDYSGYHKVSSDRSYMNRVVADTEIFAGYRRADAVLSDNKIDNVKVTITQNANDYYVAEDGTSRVRFNTQLNVAGADEKDGNIKDVAVVYINLPTTDGSGNAIEWTDALKNTLSYKIQTDSTLMNLVKSHLTALDKASKAKNQEYAYGSYSYTKRNVSINISDITTDNIGTLLCYAYEVVDSAPSTKQISLTNKNRLQFTWDMTLESYESKPFLAFAAIKYDDDDSDYVVKGTAEGADVAGANWIVSSNFVSNMVNTKTIATSGTADVTERGMKSLTQYAPSGSLAEVVDPETNVLEESADADSSETETVTEESNDSQTETETVTEDNLTSEPETVTESAPAA